MRGRVCSDSSTELSGMGLPGRRKRVFLFPIRYGVRVISLRENIDFTTPLGKAALTILGAVAELEGELIRERIRVALASRKETARKTGKKWKCGRPIAAPPEIEAQVKALRAKGKSIREIEKEMGGKISRASVSRVLSQKGRYAA